MIDPSLFGGTSAPPTGQQPTEGQPPYPRVCYIYDELRKKTRPMSEAELAESDAFVASIESNPEYKEMVGWFVIAKSLKLNRQEAAEFSDVLQAGDIAKFLFQTIPNRRRGIVDVREILKRDWSKDPNALIGERWLCKGKQAVIQGPTGVGKSSLISQWAISLIFGLRFFGINPKKAMRVLIIQAENDDGDLGEALQDMTKAMKLTEKQMEHFFENVRYVTDEKSLGVAFATKLRKEIYSFRPDIVFVDPLLSYAGCDLMNQKEMSHFMRHVVPPVLSETGATLIWVHHVSKPGGERGAGKQEPSDQSKKYQGLGSSDIQNVCRETITLSELGDGLFELNFGKRYRRLGLHDSDGNPIRKFNIQHAKDGIVWIKSEGAKATVDKKGAAALDKQGLVLKKIKSEGRVTGDELIVWAKQNGIAKNDVIPYAKTIVATHDKTKPPIGTRIFFYKPEPVEGQRKPGQIPSIYTTTPPPGFREEVGHPDPGLEPEDFDEPEPVNSAPDLDDDIFGAPTENANNEQAEGPDPNKDYVKRMDGPNGQLYTCTFCDRSAAGKHETKAEYGDTEKFCRSTLRDACQHASSGKCAAFCGFKE